MGHVQVSRLINAPPSALFAYLAEPANAIATVATRLRIDFSVVPKKIEVGLEVELLISRFGLPFQAVFRVEEFAPPERLSYRQVQGFLRSWEHTQTIEAHDDGISRITDFATFRLPFGIIGSLFDDLVFRQDVERVFAIRQEVIAREFGDEHIGQVASP